MILPRIVSNPQKNTSEELEPLRSHYDKKKDKIWPKLQEVIGEEHLHSVLHILQDKKSDTTLDGIHRWLEHAKKNNLNAGNVFGNQDNPTKTVRRAVIQILSILDRNEDGPSSSSTIEVSLGTGIERTVGSDAQRTVGADSGGHVPSPSSPSQSQSSETRPSARPNKKRKKTDDDGVDITNQLSSEDEDLKRQKPLNLEPDRAKKIYTRLKGNMRLNDDDIHIITLALQHSSTGNPPPTILDTMAFKIDENEVPRQLKRKKLKSGEPIYVPLHHKSPEHWTSCVLFFELDPEPTSNVDSIRLNFYDSMKSDDQTEKVKAFFTKWTKAHYPYSKFTFEQKRTAQQKDTTNCGVFVLETIRRLIASEDVIRPIEPRDAKERFLDMITSMDTSSPSPSADIQVIEKIKALKRTHDASTIMDGSLSITQQAVDIQPSPEFITKIKNVWEPEGMPTAEQLSTTVAELKGITEEEERIERELTVAREKLVLTKAKMLDVNEALAVVSESITVGDTTDDLLTGAHLKTTKDETMSDGVTEMLDTFNRAVNDAVSKLMQTYRNMMKDKLEEAMGKVQHKACEGIESAEREVKRLAELETHLQEKKRRLDATIKVYEGLLYLASDGGGKQVDESLSTSDMTQSQ